MPKMKTKKAITKRFKVSASGKVMSKHSGTSHLAKINGGQEARNKRGMVEVDTTNLIRWKNKSIILSKTKKKPARV